MSDLLALQPDYASIARLELGKLFDAELVEHLVDGLRKAGLETTEAAPRRVLPPAENVPNDCGRLNIVSRAVHLPISR